MPIYMDIHLVPGVKAHEVAKAHQHDLMLQDQYGCKCMTYWVDEQRETIFCLVDAVDKDAVKELHSKAHGMLPNKIIEVSSAVVQSFLGRIYDPESAIVENGLKIFHEASYRFLLFIKTEDPVLLRYKAGSDDANKLAERFKEVVKRNCKLSQGAEAKNNGDGFVFSFTSAANAAASAISILHDISSADRKLLSLSMAIGGGEPIENSDELFGDVLFSASSLASITPADHIGLSISVKDILRKENPSQFTSSLFCLQPQEEDFLCTLFRIIEEHWQEPEFDIPEYAKAMAISQSGLYRKATAVTGDSCNTLLKNFRLEKARKMLKKKKFSIAQVTFECGFTSPSYFTKCFKSRFGLLPNAYTRLVS